MIRAIQEPTLPKPWTTNVARPGEIPTFGAASRNMKTQPRPVAASRPKEPSSEIGLPVTQAGVWPWSLPYWSIIQAIVWALVLTSGAGMSRVGPEQLRDLVHERPRDLLQLVLVESRGVDVDAALGAAERDVRRSPSSRSSSRPASGPRRCRPRGGSGRRPCRGRGRRCAGSGSRGRRASPVGGLDRDLHGDLAVGLPEDLRGCRRGSSRLSQALSKWWWTTSRSEIFARAERGSAAVGLDAGRGQRSVGLGLRLGLGRHGLSSGRTTALVRHPRTVACQPTGDSTIAVAPGAIAQLARASRLHPKVAGSNPAGSIPAPNQSVSKVASRRTSLSGAVDG